jgi:hypothetical protein
MNLVLSLVIVFILLSSISLKHAVASFGGGYILEVVAVGGGGGYYPSGVALSVENGASGAVRVQDFPGLPPRSTMFYFDSYEMPAGSPFRVCAIDIATERFLNCEEYTTGYSSNEVATLIIN